MKPINCHLEMQNDSNGYQRLWIVPEVPYVPTRNMECIDDTTVRFAKKLCTLIERAIEKAITDFRLYGTLEDTYRMYADIGIIVRNTECIYASDFENFITYFTHNLLGLSEKDLDALYDIWYREE